MNKFSLHLYETSSGRKIVSEFIKSFSFTEITKIQNCMNLLKEHGLYLLNTPLVKKLNKLPPIYELRIKTFQAIRLLFYFYKPNIFIMLHGFIKKTNKIPLKELKIAIKRSKNFI